MKKNSKEVWGILLASGVVGISFLIDKYLLEIGVITLSILVGMMANTFFSFSSQEKYKTGISYAEKTILSAAIICLGVNLHFDVLLSLGAPLLVIIIISLISTLAVGIYIGKLLGFSKKLSFLLGVGNAVCGSSAIAVTEKTIKAEKFDVGISVATVNLLGVLGMFVVPVVALNIFEFSEKSSGILVGNTLQAVGQAVAGGYFISQDAGVIATVVKMTRVLFLLPVIFFAIWYFKPSKSSEKSQKIETPKIPFFIIGFIVMAGLSSGGILHPEVQKFISFLGEVFLMLAMAGIGLSISLKNNGIQSVKVLGGGLLIFMVQIIISAFLISFLL